MSKDLFFPIQKDLLPKVLDFWSLKNIQKEHKGNELLNSKNKDKLFAYMLRLTEKRLGKLTPQAQEELVQNLNYFLLEAMNQKVSVSYAQVAFRGYLFKIESLQNPLKRTQSKDAVQFLKEEYEEKKDFFQTCVEQSLDVPKALSFIPGLDLKENEGIIHKLLDLFAEHGNGKNWFDSSLPQWKSMERRILAEEVLVKKKYYLLELYPQIVKLIENYDLRIKLIPEIKPHWLNQTACLKILEEMPEKNRLKILGDSIFKTMIPDIVRMYRKIPKEKFKEIASEIDSLESFHDELIKIINEQKNEKLKTNYLHQKLKLKILSFQKYEVWIPETEYDLISMGKILSNCVGGYASAVHKGRSWVIGLKEAGELKYCLEIDPADDSIVQFVSKYNKEASQALWKSFREFLKDNLY